MPTLLIIRGRRQRKLYARCGTTRKKKFASEELNLGTRKKAQQLSQNETVIGFAGFRSVASVAYNILNDTHDAQEASSDAKGRRRGNTSERPNSGGRLRAQTNRAGALGRAWHYSAAACDDRA